LLSEVAVMFAILLGSPRAPATIVTV
jgi:hypothetical protein